ncbi:hypothetical protein, partial [Paracidovorax avenae]|uniref:hypothetical protein n=1 Tax=Paracidovorax avenae TaxID=80867 RepID=UPI001F2F2584
THRGACLALTASTLAQVAYNPAKCAEVSGSLNIRWSQIAPVGASCEDTETTTGTRAMAQAGISTTGRCFSKLSRSGPITVLQAPSRSLTMPAKPVSPGIE